MVAPYLRFTRPSLSLCTEHGSTYNYIGFTPPQEHTLEHFLQGVGVLPDIYVVIMQAIHVGVTCVIHWHCSPVAPVSIKLASYLLCVPRYLKRGVSDTGKVANDVEVEQVRLISAAQLIANLVTYRK